MTVPSRFIEVSHPVEPGMETYPGLPAPRAEVVLDYEASLPRYQNRAEFFIASVHLCGNTGTYVDAPVRHARPRAPGGLRYGAGSRSRTISTRRFAARLSAVSFGSRGL